jgi:hypothetical protein
MKSTRSRGRDQPFPPSPSRQLSPAKSHAALSRIRRIRRGRRRPADRVRWAPGNRRGGRSVRLVLGAVHERQGPLHARIHPPAAVLITGCAGVPRALCRPAVAAHVRRVQLRGRRRPRTGHRPPGRLPRAAREHARGHRRAGRAARARIYRSRDDGCVHFLLPHAGCLLTRSG